MERFNRDRERLRGLAGRHRLALTFVEVVVTTAIVGVVIIGLGVLYAGVADDFSWMPKVRETRYSQDRCDTEMLWTLRAVPPELFRQTQTAWDQAQTTWVSAGVTQTRTAATYDLYRNQTDLNTMDAWTGIIFQYQSVVYHFESLQSDMTGKYGFPQASFNNFSKTDIANFAASPANQALCDIWAINVDQLLFMPAFPPQSSVVQVTWTITPL